MARKKKVETREFMFTGTVELRGVTFFVTAEDEDAAREKAKAGEYDDYDSGGAETVNWEMNPDSLEVNE
jgi:hypothetical protein